MTPAAPPDIDVCIASYQRPDGLRALLQTLVEQETEGRFSYAIHVADNDAAKSAWPVVREFREAGHAVSYGVEPVQSISLARNLSLSFATGEYVATIDDDLRASKRWLLELWTAAERYHADVVHGFSVRQYVPQTPFYVREFHDRACPPTGSTSGWVPSTGNALIRRALIDGVAEPFDPRFGRTGGEDTDFFLRLEERRCRMVFCREAVVEGLIAPERSTLKFCFLRRFKSGTIYSLVQRKRMTPLLLVRPAAAIGFLGVLSSAMFAASILYWPLLRPAVSRFVRMLLYCGFLAGLVAGMTGYRYEEYRHRNAEPAAA